MSKVNKQESERVQERQENRDWHMSLNYYSDKITSQKRYMSKNPQADFIKDFIFQSYTAFDVHVSDTPLQNVLMILVVYVKESYIHSYQGTS